MNRKTLFGCLGSVLVVMIVAAVAFYFFFLRPLGEILDDIEVMAELADRNAEILNQDPHTPPEDGAITEAQMEQFARVQTAMQDHLGPTYDELAQRATQVERLIRSMDDGEETEGLGFRETLKVVQGLGEILPLAKEAQVRALNQEGLSLAEYRWVRENVYFAMGERDANLYLEDIAHEIKQKTESGGTIVFEDRGPMPEVAERTREIAGLYRDSLERWRPFLVFGL
jgi:hypothetical protein